MPYTYSTIAPTPAWITVDSLTGLVTVNKANAPANGFTGIARFQVSDGAATAIQDVPINVYAKYTVTTEYKELLSHRWVAKALSRSKDSEARTTVRWNATALNQVKDVAPAVSTPGARLVQFERRFLAVASSSPVNRLVQFERSVEPEAGTFSTAIAPLLGTAGLVDLGFGNTTTPLPFEFNFGVTAGFAAMTVYRFQDRIYFDTGNYTQWIEVNNSVSTTFLGWYGGGDADKYRIRWEGQDAAGAIGNPLIWEITFFREGVIQVATGTLGNNTGNNQITSPNTPIAFVDNTSFVINYLRSGSTNSYIIRQGSYTV